MFKNKGLDIVITCYMKIVNYLDLTLTLNALTMDPTVLTKNLMKKQIKYM